jgi:small-conductance mechanosensitive channel
VGIDLTVLAVFGGAVGVGIGLGLQKLASNYIAGFAILLDRSVRLGDFITADNRYGVVTRVTARYVVVRSLDGIEAIIPNDTLATTTVLNHSYSSRNARVTIPVRVSYDSDIERALVLIAEAAAAEPRTLRVPSPPEASLVRFGENGVELEVGLWIGDPENGQGNLRSAINRRILAAFGAEGIRIPIRSAKSG